MKAGNIILAVLFFVVLLFGALGFFSIGAFVAFIFILIALTFVYKTRQHGKEQTMGKEFVRNDKLREEFNQRRMKIKSIESKINKMSNDISKIQNSFYSKIYVILE